MNILGIETSCDETAAAVVRDGCGVLSNAVVSQIDIFAEYGGVIPEVAARNHLEVIMPVVNKALKDAGTSWDEIDAIAVTHTPGLLGSLLVGTLTARTLAILHNKPLYAVHHLKSHIYANWLSTSNETLPGTSSAPQGVLHEAISFPLLALVVSGGHTQIIYMREHNNFEIIGTTHDDAVGECFDKAAKILGLPYPGGPAISECAKNGDPTKYKLPHPQVEGLDFSFSGLKTAVLRAVQKAVDVPINFPSHKLAKKLTDQQRADFAASFENTATDILVEKLLKAMDGREVQSVVIAGGVSANKMLREKLPEAYFPEPKYSGDNGAMVAAAAYYEIQSKVSPTDPYSLDIMPRSAIK